MEQRWAPDVLEAALYDWHNDHRLRRQQQDIGYWVERIAGRRHVAVIGAGTGRIATPLSRIAGTTVVALDLLPARLRRAQLDVGSATVAGDACSLPIRDANLDALVFPYSTFQLLRDGTDRARAVAEAGRTLRTGGLLAIDVSDSFDTRPASRWTQVLAAECAPLGCTVEEWEKVQPFRSWLEISKSFRVEDEEILGKCERWSYASVLNLEALLSSGGFCTTSVERGYGGNDTAHRTLWLASR